MIQNEIKKNKIDRFCFLAIIIDIFFLPYFSYISVSCSILIIIFWYILHGKKTHKCWEYKYFVIIFFIMVLSTLINPIYTGKTLYETTLLTSVKRLAQFVTSIWYFLFFRYYIKTYKVSLNKIIFWALVYIFVFSIFYYFRPETYAMIKSILHPADNHTRRWLNGLILEYRFNFLWTDPNNVAYMTIALLSFYILEEKKKIYTKYILFIMSAFILFCTMSNGGLFIFGFVSLLILMKTLYQRKISRKKIKISIFAIILIIAGLFIFKDKLVSFANSDLISMITNRLNSYLDTNNLSGGRIEDTKRAFTLLNPIFLFIGSGKEGFTTENGHLYLICMYGLITYIYFIMIMFKIRKHIKLYKYITLIPLLVGFTLNIAIIEQKYLLILFLISAYYSAISSNKELTIEKNKEG